MSSEKLTVGDFGDEVARLHQNLKKLGFEVSEEEIKRKFFGPTTREAVGEFQKTHGIDPSCEVCKATASLLETQLAVTTSVSSSPMSSSGVLKAVNVAKQFYVHESSSEPQVRDGQLNFRSVQLENIPLADIKVQNRNLVDSPLPKLSAFEESNPNLPEFQYLVRGQIRYEKGLPIAKIKVKAFDKHLREEYHLGETITDANGHYEIYYSVEDLLKRDQQTVSLLVRVIGEQEGENQESILAESDVIFDARIVEKINFQISGGIKNTWSEYEQLMTEIEPLLEGTQISSLMEDEKQQDISYLSRKLRYDVKILAQLCSAHKLAEKTKMPPEVLFGLARKRFPLKLSALLSQSSQQRREAILSAINEHIIPGRFIDELNQIEERFKELVAEYALYGLDKMSIGPLSVPLGVTRLSKEAQNNFVDKFVNYKTPTSGFWKTLKDDPEFRDHVNEIQFAIQLGALTANHAPLIQRIEQLRQTEKIKNLRNLSRFNKDDWKKIILQPDETGKITFPEGINGKDDNEKADQYAGILTRMIEDAFPVESMAQRMQQSGDVTPTDTRVFFKNILDGDVSFNFDRVQIDTFLKDNPALLQGVNDVQALSLDLNTRQKLFKLVPRHEQIISLMDAGLTSAFAINQMGQKAFAAKFGQSLGGMLPAKKIHSKASYVTAATLNVITNLSPNFNFPVNVLPSLSPDVSGIPNWETLFGTFNLCGCEQCRSVHSPAAYLAELLSFLKERKVETKLSDGSTKEASLQELLFRRRPDIGDIELTCENTNVRLPYVDLTNEILENAVRTFKPFRLPTLAEVDLDRRILPPEIYKAFQDFGCTLDKDAFVVVIKPGVDWLVTDRRRLYSVHLAQGDTMVLSLGYQTFGTEEDLAASPSHINSDAYVELGQAIYPWSLPLDLGILETRIWLNKAGIERMELMRAFQPQQAPSDPKDPLYPTHPFDARDLRNPCDLAIACEIIGLTKKEMMIITGTDTHKLWEFWGLENTGNKVEIPDPADPSKTIEAALSWVEALSHVRCFLKQSGISYDELLLLLSTRFVNPTRTIRIESVDAKDPATCDTHKLIISNLTAQVLDKLHRFVRLWHKLGWTIRELDLAIVIFQGIKFNSNEQFLPRFIEQLSIVRLLQKETGESVEHLLVLWGNICTQRSTCDDKGNCDSLYDKLFLNPTVLKPVDNAFLLNPNRTEIALLGELIADHVPTLLGGFGITAKEFSELTASEVKEKDLNLANLSAIFRRIVLSRLMGISVGELVLWRNLSGIDPFNPKQPEDTLTFIQAVRLITRAGFSCAEINYLLRHQIWTDSSPAPTAETIATVLTEVRNGLQKIQEELVIETDLNGDLTRKYLALLKWDPAHIEIVISTLNTNPAFVVSLRELPKEIKFPPEMKSRISWDAEHHLLTFADIMTIKDKEALLKVNIPNGLRADYEVAVEQLYKKSKIFLDSVRVYERPIFRKPLEINSMPENKFIPQRLRSRCFYDHKTGELCFSGLMLVQEYEDLKSIAGADATFKDTIDVIREESTNFAPTDNTDNNVFLNETIVISKLMSTASTPERFQVILDRLVPRLRRLLGESLVIQKLSEALRFESLSLRHILKDSTMDIFFAPQFVESNVALDVDSARFPVLFDNFIRLSKCVFVASKLSFKSRQLDWYLRVLPNVPSRNIPWAMEDLKQAGWLYIHDLPLVPNQNSVPLLFAAFLRLLTLHETQNQLGPSGEIVLDELFTVTHSDQTKIVIRSDQETKMRALIDKVAAILKNHCAWDENETKGLCDRSGLALAFPTDFQDETGISRLIKCQSVARSINTLPRQARVWAQEDVNAEISREIKQALRARNSDEAWQQLATPTQDIIREAKREALVAYLQVRPPSIVYDGISRPVWNDVNGLFSYFLIDVETTACWKTSRIKQAISSVQLFVQRCLLNLETGLRIDVNKDDMWLQWKWMKNYRVWEVNRKILLYPEIWIEPELRDDKTPFFKELENELLQNDLTASTAEDAFFHYLEKLDIVAKLELVGMYQQDAADGQQPVLHVFGRTQGTPAVYYYRRKVGSGRWTSWERVDLDIEGDHLIPIIWNRRLYLFWPIFSIKAKQVPPTQENSSLPVKYFEIQIAWSEYKNNRWLPKKITTKRIISNLTPKDVTDQNPNDDGRNDHVFFTSISDDGLRIWPEWDNPQIQYTEVVVDDYGTKKRIPSGPYAIVDTFLFSGCHSDAIIETDRVIHGVFCPGGTCVRGMRFEGESRGLPLKLPMDESTFSEEIALNKTLTNSNFQLLYPHQDYLLSGSRPFFFEDQTHAFLVTPEWKSVSSFRWRAGNRQSNPVETVNKESLKLEIHNPVVVANILRRDLTRSNPEAMKKRANVLAASRLLDVEYLLSPESMVPLQPMKRYRFQTFYHPYLCIFIRSLNRGGVDELLTLDTQRSQEQYFDNTYDPQRLVDPDYPVNNIDFTPSGAYSQYNWELFFHIPMLIAVRLSQNQRFDEAQRWFHYVFNPTDASGDKAPLKFWRTKPFHDLQREDYLKQRIEQLIKPSSSGEPNPELALEIEEWRKNPFSPHAVARLRLTAYQKSIVMKYLDNILNWADQLFRQDTIESINEATQLYVLASEILGTRPTEMASRAQSQVQTFNSLDPLLSEFSNKLVEIEYLVPSPSPDAVLVNLTTTPAQPLPLIPYFCVPKNEKLLGYWTIVADRLFKIRHCMNIEGVVRQLALYEPPIDPSLLMRAAAAGVDLGSVLNDMNAPLPNYRFQFILQKAIELCTEVKTLGGALLSALEKRDSEALTLLRSTHEVSLLKQVREVRKQNVNEASENVIALENGKKVTEAKRDFYKNIVRINKNEQLNLDKLQSAHEWQTKAQINELIASVLPLIGDFDLGASGWGSSPVVKWKWGGSVMGMAAQATARVSNLLASLDQYEATNASIMGGFDRRWDEWKHQEALANLELKQIDNHIAAASIRNEIATKELANHDLQTNNAKDVDEMMRSKFTNRELFDWMAAQISTLFFQSYQLAYDMARRAERAYRHELGVKDSNFIQFGYWDSLKKGLLSGERLFYDLKRMEISYLDQHKREHEITKHISLAMLHPQALISLRESGSCFFELPEAVFDMDNPGHYLRRIKSISLSLPCITGPYTSVNAKLTLLGNRIRRETQTKPDGSDYHWRGLEDPRFVYDVGGIQSIVTSTGHEDGGLFTISFNDERYLPFEGAGVISSWRLELPTVLCQFNYDTISDVIIHIRYTARDGGEQLKTAVTNRILEVLKLMTVEQGKSGLFRLFSLLHDFSNQWHQFVYSVPANGELPSFTLKLTTKLFPAYAQKRTIKIKRLMLMIKTEKQVIYDPLDPLAFSINPPGSSLKSQLEVQGLPGDLNADTPKILDLGEGTIVHEVDNDSIWKFTPTQIPGSLSKAVTMKGEIVNVLDPEVVQDMSLLCHYTIE